MPASSRYRSRGCDLTQIPKSAAVPSVDLTKVLNVPSSNPFLRELQVQQGFVKTASMHPELNAKRSPDTFEKESHL